MVVPPYMRPFVLTVNDVERQRDGIVDIYRPEPDGQPRPAVLFVHGGPLPPDLVATPRDWPIFIGYGALAAMSGLVGVTLDHRLTSPAAYASAAEDVAAAVERIRALPEVDADRVGLWFFSGGGLLATDWLRERHPWLRGIALTYPLLAPFPGWGIDPHFDPVSALATVDPDLPILLTRAGRERPEVAEIVTAFTVAAEKYGAALEVIDVPEGQHGFDTADHTEDSRVAVRQAMTWFAAALRR